MKRRKTPYVLIAVAVTLTLVVAILNAGSTSSMATPPTQSGGDGKAPSVAGDPRSTPTKSDLMKQVTNVAGGAGQAKEMNFDEPLILKPAGNKKKKLKPADNLPTGQWYNRKN